MYEDLNRKDYSGGRIGTKFAVPMVDMFNHDAASLHELKVYKRKILNFFCNVQPRRLVLA